MNDHRARILRSALRRVNLTQHSIATANSEFERVVRTTRLSLAVSSKNEFDVPRKQSFECLSGAGLGQFVEDIASPSLGVVELRCADRSGSHRGEQFRDRQCGGEARDVEPLPALLSIHGDPELMRWFGNDPLPDMAAAEALINTFHGWRQLPNPGTR